MITTPELVRNLELFDQISKKEIVSPNLLDTFIGKKCRIGIYSPLPLVIKDSDGLSFGIGTTSQQTVLNGNLIKDVDQNYCLTQIEELIKLIPIMEDNVEGWLSGLLVDGQFNNSDFSLIGKKLYKLNKNSHWARVRLPRPIYGVSWGLTV